MPHHPLVFVVDDDPLVRSSLEFLLNSAGLEVETFASANEFLQRERHDGPSCLVLDLRLPELDGLAFQKHLSKAGIAIPIVFLSGEADVPSTAEAMRDGAVDFLVKPADDSQRLDAVTRALARADEAARTRREQLERAERMARLTARERQVAALVAEGPLNKQIAYRAGNQRGTVKVHRGRVREARR